MPTNPVRNKILAQLPEAELRHLLAHGEQLKLSRRQVAAAPNHPLRYVYFPLSCVLSVSVVLEDGAALEAVSIGNEGMTGVSLLIGERLSPYRIVQQVTGDALRVPVAALNGLLRRDSTLRQLLQRFSIALLRQCAQNAACNLRHTLECRMCSWLLATADRKGSDSFGITQELLSQMLGVRRQTVNLTARVLQQSGHIAYRRAQMRIVAREALQAAACECYRINRQTCERLMRLPK
jgi:CRP-like cAMP-binding protein